MRHTLESTSPPAKSSTAKSSSLSLNSITAKSFTSDFAVVLRFFAVAFGAAAAAFVTALSRVTAVATAAPTVKG